MDEIIQGKNQVLDALKRLEGTIGRDGWKIAKAISDNYVFEVRIVDAIDSGDFLRAIDWRAAGSTDGSFQYLIDSSKNADVTYDDIVERGSRNEDGTVRVKGRFPARRGIEKTNFKVHLDRFISDTFHDAEV
jgi:hypothetical protein